MTEDHGPKPPSVASGSREATAGESSSQPHGGFHQTLRKFKKNVTRKVYKRLKHSRHQHPAIQNDTHKGALSNQNIEDASPLHFSNDDKPENPSGCVKEGAPGEVSKVQATSSGKGGNLGPQIAALRDARKREDGAKQLGGHANTVASAVVDGPQDLDAADNFQATYLQPLKIFDTVIGKLENVHPYAKLVLGALSAASKAILAQTKRDKSVQSLLDKLEEVYHFMSQDDTLGKIPSQRIIAGRIAQQTSECAYFISNYWEESFWKRLGKNALSDADGLITRYNDALDALMQQFQNQAIRDVADLVRCTSDELGAKLDLGTMPYAGGAGLNITKQCLPETRKVILSQITDWIKDQDAAEPVLWLSGPAGTGKSAIAHTIASWSKDLGGLGSFFCFDRDLKDDKRHEKVFSTIARDLADRDPEMRRTLAHTVEHDNSLKTTTDIIQQWHNLLMEPLEESSGSSLEPILIVIEALDESGGAKTRRDLLRILAGKLQERGLPQITKLPSNFRILVTSRPVRDIDDEFRDARHIRRLSMDEISEADSKRDILTFVSHELNQVSDLGDKEFRDLADKADGLFEWARLACEYIRTSAGSYPIDCFDAVMSHNHGERKDLLYGMYNFILGEFMGKGRTKIEYQRVLARFHSVMGQILGSVEPLPLDALNAMRSRFPDHRERYKVEVIVEHMGSLLSGTTNRSLPIRPLHASFREFLTEESSRPFSGDFFVDLPKSQRDLAFASLGVMEHDLRFNMCNLKSSYLPNSEDIGLQNRVATCIPPHLSYSCRFWATHVRATVFTPELAKEIRSFFDNERLLFWIEALCLLNALGSAVAVLPLISQWLKPQSGYKDVLSTAMDVQRFVQLFGGMILHSTPHLYTSALPFSPIKSTIATRFTEKFPNTLRVIHGRLVNWTAIQTFINGHTSPVRSVSFSPDGTRIVSGSDDSIVRVWDAATGLPVGKPLRGHTNSVWSVSFSPDGTRIVSGSLDSTVRMWDAATGLPLGEPFRGHTFGVLSVSFSPDGTRIVSGSSDLTIQVWDAATGLPLGKPLRGHSSLVLSVSFSPDGTRIVSGSLDSTVRVWDAATGLPLGELIRGLTSAVSSVSFSPDGTRIVSGSDDSTVRVWDAATGLPLGEPFRGHSSSVLSVSFSPNGTRIVSGSADSTVRVWDAATGLPLGEPFRGHTRSVLSVSFSPDGTRIVSSSRDSTVRVWDAATELPLGEPFREHTESVLSVSFSPDGTRIVSGSRDWTVRVWDAATGLPLGEPFRGHFSSVLSVSFSPDGTRIVSGSDYSTVRVWDAATGLPLGEPFRGHTESVLSVSFSPDGTRIVSGSRDSTVRVWDAATGLPLGEPFRGHTDSVSSVSFSPDGTRIVSGSLDSTVRMWDAATGLPLGEPFRGHTDSVSSVSFSPDGTRIVSGSEDSIVRMWDAATGLPLGEPFRGHTDSVSSVSFSPDGTRIVSGSEDSTIRVWDAATAQQFQEHTEIHSSSSSLPRRRAICFSSSLEHALQNPAELLETTSHEFNLTGLVMPEDGWMVGADRRLLFWVPPPTREQPLYNPGTVLVMPSGLEIDLSRMSYGEHWANCRDGPSN